jgi:hypothetical protein
MSALTVTYMLIGRNRKYLLEKLSKSKIAVKKLEIIDEKHAKITIDKKDSLKYFAICKNSWYNKQLKIGGFCAPIYKAVKNPLITIAVILFFAFAWFADSVYLESVYVGDALLYQSIVENQFEAAGITRFKRFSQEGLNEVSNTLQNQAGISFITIKKRGNKAVVDLKVEQSAPSKLLVLHSDYLAPEDITILNLTVYSGTAAVKNGDFVKKGDVIAKASCVIKEEEQSCPLILALTAECVYEYYYETTYSINDSVKLNAVAAAKHMLGDYMVRSYKVEQINENKLKIVLKYEKTLIGG